MKLNNSLKHLNYSRRLLFTTLVVFASFYAQQNQEPLKYFQIESEMNMWTNTCREGEESKGQESGKRNGDATKKEKGGRILIEGRRVWEAGREQSGKLRGIMGKMRVKVIFNPSSSAMYVAVFVKLCFSENFSVFLFSQESLDRAGPHASGAWALFPRAARTCGFLSHLWSSSCK